MDRNKLITAITEENLDPENEVFVLAAEHVLKGEQSAFVTGRAGTGKTTFLHFITKQLEALNKNFAVIAPTGVAAVNAGGQTIHSFFKLPLEPYSPDDMRFQGNNLYESLSYRKDRVDLIKGLDVLIIDEISMVRVDTIEFIDLILRKYRKSDFPFGGVQIIAQGDPFQLPPIVTNDIRNILRRHHVNFHFFNAPSWNRLNLVNFEMKKVYRQRTDTEFLSLLDRVRVGHSSSNDLHTLNERLDLPHRQLLPGEIHLAANNYAVNEINESEYSKLNSQEHIYSALISGNFPHKIHPTLAELRLKMGAQVMFIKNDSGDERSFYNGMIGTLLETGDDHAVVQVGSGDNERRIRVERQVWKNVKYVFNEEKKQVEQEILGEFRQIPLKLAWAITIHKSQGLTFEKARLDLSGVFTPGQTYVALSRCRTLKGLRLSEPIHSGAIRTDSMVSSWYLQNVSA